MGAWEIAGSITWGGVLGPQGNSGRRRVESPVQVSPQLLLVFSVNQIIHTLVHDIRLGEEGGGGRQRERERGLRQNYTF